MSEKIKLPKLAIMTRKHGNPRNITSIECDKFDMEAIYLAIKNLYDTDNADYMIIQPCHYQQIELF